MKVKGEIANSATNKKHKDRLKALKHKKEAPNAKQKAPIEIRVNVRSNSRVILLHAGSDISSKGRPSPEDRQKHRQNNQA